MNIKRKLTKQHFSFEFRTQNFHYKMSSALNSNTHPLCAESALSSILWGKEWITGISTIWFSLWITHIELADHLQYTLQEPELCQQESKQNCHLIIMCLGMFVGPESTVIKAFHTADIQTRTVRHSIGHRYRSLCTSEMQWRLFPHTHLHHSLLKKLLQNCQELTFSLKWIEGKKIK